jgi:hypothetical protein
VVGMTLTIPSGALVGDGVLLETVGEKVGAFVADATCPSPDRADAVIGAVAPGLLGVFRAVTADRSSWDAVWHFAWRSDAF